MQLKATYQKHTLQFKFDAGTSRGVLRERDIYFIRIYDDRHPNLSGWGECGALSGLSLDDRPDFETHLAHICQKISTSPFDVNNVWSNPSDIINIFCTYFVPEIFPSIRFGVETALYDRLNGGKRLIFKNDFYKGKKPIPINGLIWMGQPDFMLSQIEQKLEQGYKCLKMKIGAIGWKEELAILQTLRQRFSADQLTLRVDANGAFLPRQAPEILQILADLQIHSIEQPIAAGQTQAMAELCRISPVPIALDEELIRCTDFDARAALLQVLKPAYLILKPSLLGGFAACQDWIELAANHNIDWWVTSALESNVGLNAIAQFTAQFPHTATMPQGLGTGQLYHNNIDSPLQIKEGFLHYAPSVTWGAIA